MELGKLFTMRPKSFINGEVNILKRLTNIYDNHISDRPLVIENMDEDQLWTQINDQINDVTKTIERNLRKIEKRALKLAEQEEEKQNSEEPEEQEEYIDEDEQNIEEEEEEEQQVEEKQPVKPQKKSAKQTIREEVDEFLRLENYLDEMDNKQDNGEDDEDDFDDNEDEEDDGEDDGDKFDEENLRDDYQDDDEQQEQQPDEDDENIENSVFDEMREAELDMKDAEIANLEEKLMASKEWRMKGEVSSGQRPLNSLLDEQLEFKASIANQTIEQMTTQEYQNTLEEKIKKRIHDEIWDDRVRKQMSTFLQDNFGSKKEAKELNQSKSQFGLGELMEQEFKNALGMPSNSTELNAKKEIYNQFRDLCFTLDSLTNLSFQPRGFIKTGEIKVSKDAAINREEKVPLTYTKQINGTVTQEKLPKSFLSREEATTEDKIRIRRLKKQKGIKINKIKKDKLKAKGITPEVNVGKVQQTKKMGGKFDKEAVWKGLVAEKAVDKKVQGIEKKGKKIKK